MGEFIIFRYDHYDQTTTYRGDNGNWYHDPKDAKRYESFIDASLTLDCLDAVRDSTYYVAELRHSIHK